MQSVCGTNICVHRSGDFFSTDHHHPDTALRSSGTSGCMPANPQLPLHPEKEEIQTSDKWEHIPTHKSSGNIAAPSLCFLLPDNTHRPSPVPSPHPFPASRWMHFSSSETKLDIHVDALAISRSLLFPLLPMQTLHGHCPAYNKHRSLQCLLSHSLLPPPQGWLFLLRQRDLRFYHPAHKSE